MARRNQYQLDENNIYLNETLSPSQMKRLNRKTNRAAKQQAKSTAIPTNVVSIRREEEVQKVKPLVPKNDKQKDLLYALSSCQQVFVTGNAGTGKTYCVAAYAADEFRMRRIKKIVLTRPNVPTGRTLGLTPGDITEKYLLWLQPLVSVIIERMGKAAFDIALHKGDIVLQPLETIRGMSYDNAFIIIDEAQNTNVDEMKAIVTRVGQDSTLVVTGDVLQSDIRGTSGLAWAVDVVARNPNLKAMSGHIQFTSDDIVRSELVKAWIKAIETDSQ